MDSHQLREVYEAVIQSFLTTTDVTRDVFHPVHLGARAAEQLDLELHLHLKEEGP